MNGHEDEPVNPKGEERDSYDELEERIRRIGFFLLRGLVLFRERWYELYFGQQLTHLLAFFTLVALIWYTSYTNKIYRATQNATQIAASQLELTEPPWLDIEDFQFDGPIFFDVNGINVQMKLFIKNGGHSPARSVKILPALYLPDGKSDPTNFRDSTCKEAIASQKRTPQFGITLFPDTTKPYIQPIEFSRSAEEVAQHTTTKLFPDSHFPPNTLLPPSLIFCVTYRSTFKPDSIYSTSYVLNVRRTNKSTGQAIGLYKIGENVDPSELTLQLTPIGGIEAN